MCICVVCLCVFVYVCVYVCVYVYVSLSRFCDIMKIGRGRKNVFTLLNILLTTKRRFANITAKGPTFVVWWPRSNGTCISRSALEVKSAMKRLRVFIVLG